MASSLVGCSEMFINLSSEKYIATRLKRPLTHASLGSQIAYIGSPLVVPTWAIANVLAALVFWVYIVSPALYYTNVWNSAYLPIQSNSVYDNTGIVYNVSRVINKSDGYQLDPVKYENYSTVSPLQPPANSSPL